MPKNKGKGGKNYKKGKKRDEGETRRDLIYKEDGQEYAQVLRMLGDGRVALQCFDGVARTGLIRGTMRRRIWINTGDIVLIGLREFEAEKADVIHKYTAEEARNLQAYGELPSTARINQTAIDMAMDGGDGQDEDVGFDFEDVIDYKWQKYWEDNETFKSKRRPGHPKKYILDMFPYPSGSGLHVGHPEGYTATDIMSRFYRMLDYDVLHPMGWDAFGLPAEQHAINTGTHPAVTTYQNIATFKRQLKSLGFSYDWSREIATTDDNYVKWTQWIFLQLYKQGLAEQSEVSVNWCPALGTVLANEEVINGLSERGNHPVVRTPLRQWIFKITQYADKLEDGLVNIQWPEGTRTAQKQWIGRSEGATIYFTSELDNNIDIEVFTTRPDTVMGVSYVVLAPEHPLVNQLTSDLQKSIVNEYIVKISSKSDLERTAVGKDKGKSGVFIGSYVYHPLTHEKLPIYIADYVLANYGTGAVMAVPAHDERDYIFATIYNLPIKQVVTSTTSESVELPYTNDDKGILTNSGDDLNGLSIAEGKEKVINKLTDLKKGDKKISYKLRDWIFSRQRYWGEPIPIYFPIEFNEESADSNPITGSPHVIRYDQPIPVDESELPLKLPDMTNFQPGDDPQGCLARAAEWRYFQKDGKWYARETNTMPQWAGSCWYYLRFTDTKSSDRLLSSEGASWLPVDLYVGGQEHAVLHLLYARFWHKVLYDLKIVDHEEPFIKLVHQGMILGSDGEKMSKSRGNVINPDDIVNEYGADILRLYEMFMGPLEASKPWQTSQLAGVLRFRDRVYNLVKSYDPVAHSQTIELQGQLLIEMNKTIKKVTEDIESLSFNTAISSLMIFSNSLISISNNNDIIPKKALDTLVLLLSPFAPHVCEELWNHLGYKDTLSYHPWPKYDPKLCIDTTIKIAVQVNGKVRSTIDIDIDMEESNALDIALQESTVKKWVDGLVIKKVVYVKGKILNILVGK